MSDVLNSAKGTATNRIDGSVSGATTPTSTLPEGWLGGGDFGLREALCSGDPAAQHELLVNRCGRMLAFLSRKYEWWDLPGELLLHLQQDDWRRLRTWNGNSSLKTWLETIATRLCLHRLKERRRFVPLEQWNELEGAMNRHLDGEEERFSRRDLLKAMALLKSDQERRLIVLHTLQGLPLAEVAALMGITRGNADVVKHRAIRNMRKALGLEGRTTDA